jgi:hypothetical protein
VTSGGQQRTLPALPGIDNITAITTIPAVEFTPDNNVLNSSSNNNTLPQADRRIKCPPRVSAHQNSSDEDDYDDDEYTQLNPNDNDTTNNSDSSNSDKDCVRDRDGANNNNNKAYIRTSFYEGTGDMAVTLIAMIQYFMVINWFRKASQDIDDDNILVEFDRLALMFTVCCIGYFLAGMWLLHSRYALFNNYQDVSLTILSCLFLISTLIYILWD